MKDLIEKLKATNALIKPVDETTVSQAEHDLKIVFSTEYKDYLKSFGVISFGSNEVYGLGVKPTSYLSLYKMLPEMREDKNFPSSAVPLTDIGDGHFYLYDNQSKTIFVWASPNGGIVKKVKYKLETFLISLLFN